MQYFSKKNKSLLSKVSSLTLISTFATAILVSANVMADNATDMQQAKSVKVSQHQNKKSHAFTIQKQTKNKRAANDNKVGAFSLSDGAREGAYGDGIYSNAD